MRDKITLVEKDVKKLDDEINFFTRKAIRDCVIADVNVIRDNVGKVKDNMADNKSIVNSNVVAIDKNKYCHSNRTLELTKIDFFVKRITLMNLTLFPKMYSMIKMTAKNKNR